MSFSPSPEHVMMCPICLETMKPPILQCKVGHSMCGSCIKETGIKMCPTCREALTNIRNYQLEQLIEGIRSVLKLNCRYLPKGCKYAVSSTDKRDHETECKYREFRCEGAAFANWRCSWTGDYLDMYRHFKNCHEEHAWMEYKTEATLKMALNRNFYDVQIISFFNGQHYFFYKHKVDLANRKVYWHFQLVGLKSQASNFYYEFEVHKDLKKFKVTEFCSSDAADIGQIFSEEKCVVMSFASVKNYLNEDEELPFKFRIMSNKKTVLK